MKKTLLLGLGGGVGFLLGARAGRPAYDRISARWSELAEAAGLGQLATSVKEAGVDVRERAVSRASTKVATSADSIVDRMATDAPAPDPADLMTVPAGTHADVPTGGSSAGWAS